MLGALVIMEHRRGRPAEINAEVCALAEELCRDDWAGLILGGGEAAGLCAALAPLCPRLYTAFDPSLEPGGPSAWRPFLKKAVAELAPRLVLLGHTASGLDLAPALAQDLGAGLASDVIAARWQGEAVVAQRPVYGGKLLAEVVLKPAPVGLLTLRPGSLEPLQPNQAGTVVALTIDQPPPEKGRRFLEFIDSVGGVDLTKAKAIVAVGRGIEGPENIELARDLAAVLGAELACSRPVADLGWLDKERQVGLSGQTVKPKIYLALGISGAFQHQAGMAQSETIIAVNHDPQAPIFDVAHFGVVADLFDVVPALIEVFRQ